jgi:hypothetical protein
MKEFPWWLVAFRLLLKRGYVAARMLLLEKMGVRRTLVKAMQSNTGKVFNCIAHLPIENTAVRLT